MRSVSQGAFTTTAQVLTLRPSNALEYTSQQVSQPLLVRDEHPLVRRVKVGVFPGGRRLYKSEKPEDLWARTLVR
jgi:hypothetical protein